jgi:hypothetical protein
MAESAPVAPEESEPETIGDLIDSIVGKAVPRAIEDARKAWAKDLADLLDIGADSSEVDPANPPTDPAPAPAGDPAVVPVATGVRAKKFSLL